MMMNYGKGVCYSGFRRGQSPASQIFPTREQVKEDLEIIIQHGYSYIRMYEPNQFALDVLSLIRYYEMPIKVMLGIDPKAEYNNPGCAWGILYTDEQLAANAVRNDDQITKLINMANEFEKEIFAVSVGNESTPDWGSDLLTEDRLIVFANRLREGTKQLVTYNEGAPEWPKLSRLANYLDMISIHSYPMWNHVTSDRALEFTKQDYGKVKDCYPNKQIVFSEYGWATRNNDNGQMVIGAGSEANQKEYLDMTWKWLEDEQIPAFVFEMFDEPWKGSANEDEPEKHWGLYREDRTPKLVMQGRS